MNKKSILIVGGIVIAGVALGGLFIKHDLKVNKKAMSVSVIGGADGPTSIFVAGKLDGKEENASYVSISMDEAKEIFATGDDYVIVDVRREDEFSEGHIPGAINIPNESIENEPKELPHKDQAIYVYCRSGNRSKQASQKLVDLGYNSVVEFGGIIDWTGEIEK